MWPAEVYTTGAVHSVLFTVYSMNFTLYSILCTVYSTQYSVQYSVQCTVLCTVYTIFVSESKLMNARCQHSPLSQGRRAKRQVVSGSLRILGGSVDYNCP